MAHITALKQAFFLQNLNIVICTEIRIFISQKLWEMIFREFRAVLPDIDKLKLHNMLALLRYYSVRYKTKKTWIQLYPLTQKKVVIDF